MKKMYIFSETFKFLSKSFIESRPFTKIILIKIEDTSRKMLDKTETRYIYQFIFWTLYLIIVQIFSAHATSLRINLLSKPLFIITQIERVPDKASTTLITCLSIKAHYSIQYINNTIACLPKGLRISNFRIYNANSLW